MNYSTNHSKDKIMSEVSYIPEADFGKKNGVGVVIGRFQVPKLHPGHLHVISQANRHRKLMILVGRSQNKSLITKKDPLDFESIRIMIQSTFPHAVIAPLLDQPDDEVWSKNVDVKIREHFPLYASAKEVTLYGGRDSFIPHYHGQFFVNTADDVNMGSGTEIRQAVGATVHNSEDWRCGVIYAAHNIYPLVNMAVDIAVMREESVLLVQKPNNPGKWRFPGGFVDMSDTSLESAATREILEEVSMAVSEVEYLGSRKVKDWRDTEDTSIQTALFLCHYLYGSVQVKDDLAGGESHWFPINDSLLKLPWADDHQELARMFINHQLVKKELEK